MKAPWKVVLARLGPLGRSPWAPGTVATAMAGIPTAWVMSRWTGSWSLLLIAIAFYFGCWVCHGSAQFLGRKDPRELVWDEWVGYLVTTVGLPATAGTLLAGFFLFRLADVLKPWPVSFLDKRIDGGLGIMIDDVAAGLLARVVLVACLPLWS